MTHKAALALALVFLIAGAATAFAQNLTAPSTWKNQRGSIMTISSIAGDGTFKGSYENKAAGYPCQSTYDMNGTVKRHKVSFVVVWKNKQDSDTTNQLDCRSLTVWTGHLSGNQISTHWSLAYGNAATGKIDISRGRDMFTKQ